MYNMAFLEPIFHELNESNVRYIVVGGIAVILHGYVRNTTDIDLIIDLAPQEAKKCLTALRRLNFRPRLPVKVEDFADAKIRKQWIQEKGMKVFSLFKDSTPPLSVDLFAEFPIPLEKLWKRSTLMYLKHTSVRVVDIDDLIELKKLGSRGIDLEDLAHLQKIKEAQNNQKKGKKLFADDKLWRGWDAARYTYLELWLKQNAATRLAMLEDIMKFAYQYRGSAIKSSATSCEE